MIVGIVFSREKDVFDPLSHVTVKRPTYDRLLDLCLEKGWQTFVFTRRTYLGNGIFDGAWKYQDKKLSWKSGKIKADLVYDRTGGIKFPPINDSLKVVNTHEFKVFCWDKWAAYESLSQFMPQTYFLPDMSKLDEVVSQIDTDWVVVKPYNGLGGQGIYIGPKGGQKNFKFSTKYKKYVVQEFIDTSRGVTGITSGLHDIRVVIINGQPVWGHVRIPPKGIFTSNARSGGVLSELNLNLLPDSITQVVSEIARDFFARFDNPIFSIDFGVDKSGKPYIFEINDQIGFPKWEMDRRDHFLKELVRNFEMKLRID